MSATFTANILLLGLEVSLEAELTAALDSAHCRSSSASLHPQSDPLDAITDAGAEVVFCPSDPMLFRRVMAAIRSLRSAPPVVAVSRHPEITDWLDAIEAGASDYCGAPFESHSLRWILESIAHRAA